MTVQSELIMRKRKRSMPMDCHNLVPRLSPLPASSSLQGTGKEEGLATRLQLASFRISRFASLHHVRVLTFLFILFSQVLDPFRKNKNKKQQRKKVQSLILPERLFHF